MIKTDLFLAVMIVITRMVSIKTDGIIGIEQ